MFWPLFAAVLGGSLALLLARPAFALSEGECGTPEEMTARLKAEGQRSIGFADELGEAVRALVFTANADRSAGYVLRADQPMKVRASRICVREQLAELRLFDARRPELQKAVLLKATKEDALRACEEVESLRRVRKNNCFAFNEAVERDYQKGLRVMLQGFYVKRQDDGQLRHTGRIFSVLGRAGRTQEAKPPKSSAESGRIIISFIPEGASYTYSVIDGLDYTPYGLSLLE